MKKLFNTDFLLIFLVPMVFLVAMLLTLDDYGINWDEPKHLIRGQSYLHFILTGKKDFLDFPAYPNPKGAPDYVDFSVEGVTNSGIIKERKVENSNIRRSYYQSDFYTFDHFMTKHVHTHPEVNGLLASFTNYIFFQKLSLIEDIEAYHLFIILVVFLIVAVVAWSTYLQFGIFASIVASSSLVLYPLVFAESHFNLKDPVLMSFFGLSILTFWYGFSKSRPLYILLSSLLTGFALGTKFNTFFLVPILGSWLLFVLIKRYQKKSQKKIKLIDFIGGWKILISLIAFPLISIIVLFAFSPYLWSDPIDHFMEIVDYYKGIGTEPLTPEMTRFLKFGWNIYPLIWILYTTPLPILFLSILGIGYNIYLLYRKHNDFALLILLWFTIPIVRVMWPGANIYGGVRQIMEFIPSMAILAGMGAFFLVGLFRLIVPQIKWISKLTALMIIMSLLFVVYEISKIHPNQNVYFNHLVGGLKGGKEQGIPSWGNTYGNVYLQGIDWINENAETNARLALPINYISSIPRLKLRQDIDLDNHHFSGSDRTGEYAMEMDYDWPLKSRYKYSYYETFLEPVHQVLVGGVPILKIWKNDLAHTKKGYEQEVEIKPSSIAGEDEKIRVSFPNKVLLTRLIIDHFVNDCKGQIEGGFVAVSQDGKNFTREPNTLIDLESPESSPGMDNNTFVFMFPARPALSVIINPEDSRSCLLKEYQITVMGLTKKP